MTKSHSTTNFKNSNITWLKLIFPSALFCLFFIFFSIKSQALGLSTFRIYLDNAQREYNFVVYNKEIYKQNCKMNLRHYNIDENGQKTVYEGDNLPKFSAKKFIRFSPKRFEIGSGQAQNVRFQMRRKANQQSHEYRSYLSLDCAVAESEQKNYAKSATLEPKLRHNIPIIVRTGKVDINVSFKNIKVNKASVSATLTKDGGRSIYGDVHLIDKRNGKILSTRPRIGIHLEAKNSKQTLATHDIPLKYLQLRFIEDPDFGGNKMVEIDVL